ncbi:zeaxanthin epoxidase, chloroplastic-like isoform X2 [Ananas comosus]|uniref:Zeaxanthin epoxidase, chloroplastic-like isoform X2 n=1 Tax=Ananas comosus TaxID=4615 RepID=A0A6P5F448_ANACO|nr:zeaxanthin epoxidase, chloroplastic-like isoform X2 [Ananas comosus]
MASREARKPRILIAGGGVAGLVLALAAKRRGFEVRVFEKDLSAVRGEGQYRGPIILHGNALAVLAAIDPDVARQVLAAACVTGDRLNGLADGITGDWFIKIDLLTPARKKGLPLTRSICRMTLQDILLKAIGSDTVYNRSKVVDFREHQNKVTVILGDGREYEGDVLVGADGIWSKVRAKLFGWQDAQYSNYTCYSGSVDYVPSYISTVGYRVFVGFNQYFVACDIGCGKMQWYGFHKEPPGSADPPTGKRKRLLELYEGWCSEVVALISRTSESMILRRDLYDRDMIYTWGRGRITLVGDAAHAMQPALGQSGCMAIEDCYQLVLELEKAYVKCDCHDKHADEIALAIASFHRYERKRILRVGIVHAVTRMAARMSSTYRPYLDFGPGCLSVVSHKSENTKSSYLWSTIRCRTYYHAYCYDLDAEWPWGLVIGAQR